MVIETKRLFLREMTQADFPSLCKILQDDDVMYAYEGAFNDREVKSWLDKQLANYKDCGFGLKFGGVPANFKAHAPRLGMSLLAAELQIIRYSFRAFLNRELFSTI